MYKIYLILLSSLFFGACGSGGGGNDDGNGSNSNSHSKHLGTWASSCLTNSNGGSVGLLLEFAIEQNTDVLGLGEASFETSDCSGTPSFLLVLAGVPTYPAETITGVCTADQIDIEFSAASINNGTAYTGETLKSLLLQLNIPSKVYNIVCQHDGEMLVGDSLSILGASSSALRPNEMNVSTPFTRYEASTSDRSSLYKTIAIEKSMEQVIGSGAETIKD